MSTYQAHNHTRRLTGCTKEGLAREFKWSFQTASSAQKEAQNLESWGSFMLNGETIQGSGMRIRWIRRIGCLLSSRSSQRAPLPLVSLASDMMLFVNYGGLVHLPGSIAHLNWAPGSGLLAHPQPIAGQISRPRLFLWAHSTLIAAIVLAPGLDLKVKPDPGET
jgi:hypothetical protein